MIKLDIDINEVARYLGFGENNIDDKTMEDINWAVDKLRETALPRSTYQVFDLEKGDNIKLTGTNLTLLGSDIKSLLKTSDKCILLAVTLGQGVDELIRKTQIINLNRSVILDFCASSMIESVCNQLDDKLRSEYKTQNKFFTDRFSPGYGDLPLSTQLPLCDVLKTEKTTGIAVSSAGIMIPRKSITAVIGISDKKQQAKLRGCSSCDLSQTCPYKKGGKTCAE